MRSTPKFVMVTGLALLAVAGCYKNPANSKSKPLTQGAPASGPLAAASGCPASTPDKQAIASAIKATMIQIYGGEEAPTQYTVTAVTPTDCRNLAITYHAMRRGAETQKSSVVYSADDKWYLMLYRKAYLVK